MSSEAIEEKRRIELKAIQVQALLVEQERNLLNVTRARKSAQDMHLEALKSFQQVKAEILKSLESSKCPHAALRELHNAVGALRSRSAQATQWRSAATRAQSRESMEICRAHQIKAQFALLETKLSDVVRRGENRKEHLETEVISDSAAISRKISDVQRPLSDETDPEGITQREEAGMKCPEQAAPIFSGANYSGGALRVDDTSERSKQPAGCLSDGAISAQERDRLSPGLFADQIKSIEASDSAEKSVVQLCFSERIGDEVRVELTRRGERSLEIRLLADTPAKQRSLWAQRERIAEAFSSAGYLIDRFVIGGAARV
jgi:hypothetical protein